MFTVGENALTSTKNSPARNASPSARDDSTSTQADALLTTMAADSTSLLQRQVREDAQVKEDYHNKLVEKDDEIRELNEKLQKFTEWKKTVIKDASDVKRERDDFGKRMTTAEEKVKKLEDDRKHAKRYQDGLEDKAKEADKTASNLSRQLDNAKNEIRRLKDPQGTTAQLHQHISNLQKQLQESLEREQTATTELQATHDGLLEMYKEEPMLSLQDCLDRAKTDHEKTRTLAHQPSQSSLSLSSEKTSLNEQEGTTKPTNKRAISGASLKDQLDDAGYASSVDGDGDETEEENIKEKEPAEDDTITAPDIFTGPKATAPTAATAPSTIRGRKTGRLAIKDDTFAKPPSPPYLPFLPPTQMTYTSGPRANSATEMWRALPFWMKLAHIFAILIFLIWFLLLVKERHTWRSANYINLSHNRIKAMTLSGASSWNPFLGFFSGIDEAMGAGYGLLG
jgi:hypothetical protein